MMSHPAHQEIQLIEGSLPDLDYSTPNHHYHKRYGNLQSIWFGTDTQRRYNKFSEYTPDTVFYNFNSSGYRSDELAPTEYLFLGCSYTQGIGIPLDHTWSKRLHNDITPNQPYINLAFQGGGFSYFIRTLLKCISIVTPKTLILVWPYGWRHEMVTTNNQLFIWTTANTGSSLPQAIDRDRVVAYELYQTTTQNHFEIVQGLQTIATICRLANVQFVHTGWIYSDEKLPSLFENTVGAIGNYIPTTTFNNIKRWEHLPSLARDSSHPGRIHNLSFYEEIRCGLNTIHR